MNRAARGLQVAVSDEHGRRLAMSGLARWLVRVAPARARGFLSVALVSDAHMRALNRRHRRRDYATDVLSFPVASNSPPRRTPGNRRSKRDFASASSASSAVERSLVTPGPQSLIPGGFLGDIVIAQGVARRQARVAGHSETTELRVLALHGLLHLLGYDHGRDEGTMERLERKLRQKGGLREGLMERSAPRRKK